MSDFVPPDEEEVLTRWNKDIAYKLCQCSRCGTIRRCVPSFDFYKKSDDPSELLICEACFMSDISGPIIPIVPDEDDKKSDPADWWKN